MKTILEVAEIKQCSRPTLCKAIKRGLLNVEYRWEKRNGYERKITYIYEDEKYDAYMAKSQKEDTEEYLKKCNKYRFNPESIISKYLLKESTNNAENPITHLRDIAV